MLLERTLNSALGGQNERRQFLAQPAGAKHGTYLPFNPTANTVYGVLWLMHPIDSQPTIHNDTFFSSDHSRCRPWSDITGTAAQFCSNHYHVVLHCTNTCGDIIGFLKSWSLPKLGRDFSGFAHLATYCRDSML